MNGITQHLVAISIKLQIINQPFRKLFQAENFHHKIIFKYSILLIAAITKLVVKLILRIYLLPCIPILSVTWISKEKLELQWTPWEQKTAPGARIGLAFSLLTITVKRICNNFSLNFLNSRIKLRDQMICRIPLAKVVWFYLRCLILTVMKCRECYTMI